MAFNTTDTYDFNLDLNTLVEEAFERYCDIPKHSKNNKLIMGTNCCRWVGILYLFVFSHRSIYISMDIDSTNCLFTSPWLLPPLLLPRSPQWSLAPWL